MEEKMKKNPIPSKKDIDDSFKEIPCFVEMTNPIIVGNKSKRKKGKRKRNNKLSGEDIIDPSTSKLSEKSSFK